MNRHLLGGLSSARFMREYWQKQPLLVRGAFPDFQQPCTARDVLTLAQREDAESRLVRKTRGKWALDHGPFIRAQLQKLPARDWTLLVQDTQHFLPAAHEMLRAFDFIPHARVDDLMVSLAAPGGGVGAHYDSYDVFLVQGSGERRWRISAQRDLSLKSGVPLKILRNFKLEQEWVLAQGDMLYLPPGYAHEGVALSNCLTWSVGFRAPTYQDVTGAFLDHLRDTLAVSGQYADPLLKPTAHPGEIPASMLATMQRELAEMRWEKPQVHDFLGRFLSEPKAHVFFEPPATPLTRSTFARRLLKSGAILDLRSRCLYRGRRIFANGESYDLSQFANAERALMHLLADRGRLPAGASGSRAIGLLYDWYCAGYIHIAE